MAGTESDISQSRVFAFMRYPESYSDNVETVEEHETHGAIVFLAGNIAYKIKKAVKFPYMDF